MVANWSNPPIQLRKNSANSTVTVIRHAFSAALDILSIIVFLLLIESLNLNFLLFLLMPFSSNTSTPKITQNLTQTNHTNNERATQFWRYFLELDKVDTNWAWVRPRPFVVRPWTSYLEIYIKMLFPAVFRPFQRLKIDLRSYRASHFDRSRDNK